MSKVKTSYHHAEPGFIMRNWTGYLFYSGVTSGGAGAVVQTDPPLGFRSKKL